MLSCLILFLLNINTIGSNLLFGYSLEFYIFDRITLQADSSGLTPLMDGARMGHEAVCEILLSHGADVLQLDNLRRTTLHHVTQAGQVLQVQYEVEIINTTYFKL